MRKILLDGWSIDVMQDCCFILGFSIVTYMIIHRLVNWRIKD